VPAKPDSCRFALLDELCRKYGFCTDLEDTDLEDASSANEAADRVIRAEGLDPITVDSHMRRDMIAVAHDWLFAPNGRGVTSGLPW
jgi:hypothetical protein